MSRLFRQIQQAQAKERVFTPLLTPSPRQQRRFNLLPCICIISLFAGIVVSYFYTNQNIQPALPKKEASLSEKEIDTALPIQEKPEVLVEDLQQPLRETPEVEIPTEERNFEAIFPGKRVAIAEDEPIPEEELIYCPHQWNFAPLRDWIQEHWERAFPKLQELRDSLSQFAYLDVTQPIPEKEISAMEQERLEHIRRFLKKFKVDAVRIDGSYSRVMANGQSFYVNTVVSQRPRLKLTGITPNEMIFKDEYNQEYKKEISQND